MRGHARSGDITSTIIIYGRVGPLSHGKEVPTQINMETTIQADGIAKQ